MRHVAAPLIAISADRSVLILDSLADISLPTSTALKNRYFDGLRLIDATGQCFLVRQVVHKPLTFFERFLNLKIPVALDLSFERTLSMDEVKQLVRSKITDDPEYWEAAYDLDELNQAVLQATTIEEVFSLLR